ncbi:MAG: urease accessory protein UreD, partial [Verrucomicrobia bacterium]|nr:urease accessory protein UreD [Verrucomicrobiota bacterium]
SGDVLESDLSVTTGAKVLMTTPSASRVHISRGGSAHVIQRFHVGNNGWLEYSPSMLMPQAGSLYRQVSEVYVEYGGDLFFMEMLAPGRVARGEYFKFKELDWTFNLHYDQKLICRERFVLEPNEDSCYALQNPIPNAWFAGGYIVSSRLSDSKGVLEQLRSLNDEHIRVGISRLYDYCWTVRLLACNGILMRKTISTLRELLSGILPELKTKCRVV